MKADYEEEYQVYTDQRIFKVTKKVLIAHVDARNIYGLPCHKLYHKRRLNLIWTLFTENVLITADRGEIGYFVEVKVNNTNETIEKTKDFLFVQNLKKIVVSSFTHQKKNFRPRGYKRAEKRVCAWSNRNDQLCFWET